METIKKLYIVNEDHQRIAVQIDIKDFERLEKILEDYALGQLMEKNDSDENLDLQEAKKYYDHLDKA